MWDKNLFYGGIVDSDGNNGAILGKAPALEKSTGWTQAQIGAGSLTGAEFALRSSSLAINSGANLGTSLSEVLESNLANFESGCGVGGVGLAAFPRKNQDSFGAWDIGADVYVSGDTQAPAKPSGLSVR